MQATADLRLACRTLLRRPTFALIAVATLALGIGANTAIFSFVDGIAFRPLPVREAERLVAILPVDREGALHNFSYPDFRDLRDGMGSLEGLAAFAERPVTLALGDGSPQLGWAMLVSEEYFPLLGVEPRPGRSFTREEGGHDGGGGAAVAIVSARYFQRALGGDPGAIGRVVRVNDQPFTVVGVAPAGFMGTRLFAYAPDLWVPVAQHAVLDATSADWLESRTAGSFQLVGRLAAGASRERVEREAAALVATIAARHAADTGRTGVRVFSNRTAINPWASTPEQMRTLALLALAGVGVVLLVAGANVANLMLARASGRRHELGVRSSLGASRGSLLRLLLAESLVLATLGGVAGLVVGRLGSFGILRLLPDLDYDLAIDVQLDGRVLLFTAAVSLLAALLCGLLPALRAARVDPGEQMKRGRDERAGGGRLRQLLVAAQVAFSVVVLVAAVLFTRSFAAARQLDLGFSPAGAAVFGVDPGLAGYTPEAAVELEQRLAEALRAVPGVQAVTWADDLPLDGNSSSTTVSALGRSVRAADRLSAHYQSVAPGHFAVLDVPLLAGRGFVDQDARREREPVVISATLARRLWGEPDTALGQQVVMRLDAPPREVVGVVADVKANWLGEEPEPALYVDRRRDPWGRAWFVVRHDGELTALAPSVRRVVTAVDPRLPMGRLESFRDHLAPAYAAPSNGAWLAGAFGSLALLLAAAGLYGVVAFWVAQRVREVAIRMAVGAAPRRVLGELLGRVLRLVGAGVAAGLLGAWAVGRLLRDLLYGVSPHDPGTLLAVALLLLTVAVLASLVPARRALRIDPARALRAEV